MGGRGRRPRITQHAQGNLTELRATRVTSIGSITGTLDALSVRRKNTFQVFDDLWKRPVGAEFADDEMETVKAAIAHRVVVSGIVMRNAKGQPVRIRDPRLRIMPDGPPLSGLVGVAPGFVGDKTLAEYMESVG